jgi:DNA invertase Pin-like site-specific DNA recombinase
MTMDSGEVVEGTVDDLSRWVATVVFEMAYNDSSAARLRVLRDAMTRLEAERERLRDEQKRAVRAAVESGMSESQVAREAGVSRLTVRAWLGKSV